MPAEEGLFLRAPPTAIELQDGGIAGHELGERAAIAGVIGQHAIRKPGAGCERGGCGLHGHYRLARTPVPVPRPLES